MTPDKGIFTLQDALRLTGPVSFSTLVKPAGSACNLNCSYCYYLDKAGQYGGRETLMSPDLLEIYIRQYIEAQEGDTVSFCWHGGEPALPGLDYYRRALEFQKKYAAGKRVSNSIQTNGTLIDEAWCDFFVENGFLVGLSLDGPAEIHDAYRRTRGEAPTFKRVMQTVRLFRRKGVEFNTLSVVSRRSEDQGREIYRFLRDEVGSRYLQFLPAVERVAIRPGSRRPVMVPPEAEEGQLAPWSVSSEGYGRFLCDIFDLWVREDVGKVFVQLFDATLSQYVGVRPGVCSMGETCGESMTVEHNGDVYPCDHFVYPDYRLGNIRTSTLRDLYQSEGMRRFGLAKRNALPGECLACSWFFACHGECPKHRFETGQDGGRKSSLCTGLKRFFAHADPYMCYMKERLLNHQPPAWVMAYARQKMNDNPTLSR